MYAISAFVVETIECRGVLYACDGAQVLKMEILFFSDFKLQPIG
jgi:hypothetical protein